MTAFINLDTLPAGSSLYTLAVAGDDDAYDEVDFVASTNLTARAIARRAQDAGALEGYDGCRVVGVADQSRGFVVWEDATGDALA